MAKRKPDVGIVMGSDSDWETIKSCATTLESFDVPYEARVISAHRTPDVAAEYARTTLYSTLSPCEMCSGTVLLYRIPRVVVGEDRTFQGPQERLRSRGVELSIVDDEECVSLMQKFIAAHPELWNEDIGE